jgi:hypothetical protein
MTKFSLTILLICIMGLTLMDISSTSPGPIENKWVFTEEQLRRTPSIVAGLSFSEEQQLIRHGCTFIRRLADRLNDAQRDSPKMYVFIKEFI